MNDYIEARFDLTPCFEDATDVLAAILADRGFESFVPDSGGLTAYIKSELFTPGVLDVADELPFDVEVSANTVRVEGRDWNAEWERHYFKPIVIGTDCVVHSTFHTDVPRCRHDIVIDPKMAFGTGHHATTRLMASRVMELTRPGMQITDMGTGTGILAILAAKCGASRVDGVEIDPAAYANALENVEANGVAPVVSLHLGDASALAGIAPADVLLANINRNIILADIAAYADALKPGGLMALSGFYVPDAEIIAEAAAPLGLSRESLEECDDWACLTLIRN